jgi:plastocyanin
VRVPLALLLATPLLLAGCSHSGAVVPDQDAEGRYVIHLTAANRFEPAKARVPVGATVAWVVDGGAHDVNADDGSFSSADRNRTDAEGYPLLLMPGETWTHTFNETGRFPYWCHTHHEFRMRGLLVVE